jgi:hypothetical protein
LGFVDPFLLSPLMNALLKLAFSSLQGELTIISRLRGDINAYII